MTRTPRFAIALMIGIAQSCVSPAARAQDYFAGFGFDPQPPAAPARVMYAPVEREDNAVELPRRPVVVRNPQAWCVRSCDGRYFPVSGPDNASRAESCKSFCPASPTSLVYGDDIDSAVTDKGKSYSELPNAFRYRKELIAGCTCNGKDPAGLAAVSIESDSTLRRGDLVAGERGLEVATRIASRGAAKFSPLPRSAQGRYRNLPVIAAGK